MAGSHHWLIGVVLVVIWLAALTAISYMQGHQIIESWLFYPLLTLPIAASFLVARADEHAVPKALLLVLLIAILGPLFDLVGQRLGTSTDFPGVTGAKVTFFGYLLVGTATVGIGLIAGVLFKKLVR